MKLSEHVDAYLGLLAAGQTVLAMERFYADEVCVFENRELARAGRAKCLAFEHAALERLGAPPRFTIRSKAVNEAEGSAFLEYTIRFAASDGRPMRLDEVAVQRWESGQIVSERFYYEGLVDEGDVAGEESGARAMP